MEEICFQDDEIERFHRKIADNIRRLRKERGVSQLDLALSIGHKSMSMVAKIEAGIEGKRYNLEHIYRIAKVLGVDIRDIF